MAYLLYYDEEVIGCYQRLDLLRYNLLIIFYRLYHEHKLTANGHDVVKRYLLVPDFQENSLQEEKLKQEIIDCNMKIEKISHEDNGFYALNNIKNHIDERFDILEEILTKDARITATIPGKNALNHKLGTMYYDDWELLDKHNWKEITTELYEHIAMKIKDLVKLFNTRIIFGDVYYQNASDTTYQVWSANALNFNLPENSRIPGDYQAGQMKFQEKGVFGIVVTPRYGYKDLILGQDSQK